MQATTIGGGYEARFGFGLRTLLYLAGCGVFTALLLVVPAGALAPGEGGVAWLGWVFKVAGLLLFGGGGLLFLVSALSRRVAFRADPQGVALGAPPYPMWGMHRRPLELPWSDLAEVVLFTQETGQASVAYVGLGPRPGADPGAEATTFKTGGMAWRSTLRLLPHVPEEVLARSRPVIGWSLDERRLVEAVAAFGPHVRVVRLEPDGSIHPVRGQHRPEEEAAALRELRELIAAGLPAWTAEHTAAWRSARPGLMLARGLPALGWLALVLVLGAGPDPAACTVADPCEPDLLGSLLMFIWLGQVVWLLWLPATAWWGSPVLVGTLTLAAVLRPQPHLLAAAGLAWLLVAWTFAVGHSRRRARRRQEELARGVAGTRVQTWPGPRQPPRMLGRILLGVALLGLGAWPLVWGVGELRATARDVATAPRVEARVVDYADEDTAVLSVGTGPPRVHYLHLDEDHEYPEGTRLTMIDGHRLALAAEPYDATPQVSFGAGLMLAGAAVLGRRHLARRRIAALLGSPQPAVAMRATPYRSRRRDAEPAVVLYAADDFTGEDPLLVVPVTSTTGLRPQTRRASEPLAPTEPVDVHGLPTVGAYLAARGERPGALLVPRAAARPGRWARLGRR